jgi:ribosomal protein S27E
MDNTNPALQSLINFQNLLGELGFTLSGDGGYYKDYGLLNGGQARLIPLFDQGLSADPTYVLSGIQIANQQTIPILQNGGTALDQFPRECLEDVTKMIATMAPQSRIPNRESFIVTAQCNICSKTVSSFSRVDEKVSCLSCLLTQNS